MFCTNCGKQFQGEGYLCPECAAAMTGAAPVSQPPVQESTYTPPQANPYGAQQPQYDYQQPQQPVYNYQQPQYNYQQPAYNYQQPQAAQVTPGFTLGAPEGGKKKSKAGLIILLVVLGIAIIGGAVALALNWDRIFGETVKIPEDPDEYVAFLEEPSMEAVAEGVSQVYGQMLESSQAGAALDADIQLFLGDDIILLLEQGVASSGLEMDMNWLQDITLRLHSAAREDQSASAMSLALLLGSTRILSMDAVVDVANAIVYMAVPELNDTPLQMDMGAVLAQQGMGTYLEDAQKLSQDLMKALPEEGEVKELVSGCGSILLKYLTGAEKSTETLLVGNGEQEVTVLTVKLTAPQVAEMILELLEYVKDSPVAQDFADAIIRYVNGVGDLTGSGEQIPANQFDVMMEEAISDMQENAKTATEDNYLLLDTYADGAAVVGRRIQMYTDGEKEGEVSYAAIMHERQYYFEARLDKAMSISGEGTVEDGVLSATYLVNVEGTDYLTLELENVDQKTGQGAYILSPEAALMDEMDMEGLVGTFATGMKLKLEVGENSGKLSVISGKVTLLSIGITATVSEDTQVTLPSGGVDVMDEAALMQWLQGMDLSKVIQTLKDAGLPQELQQALDVVAQNWSAMIG